MYHREGCTLPRFKRLLPTGNYPKSAFPTITYTGNYLNFQEMKTYVIPSTGFSHTYCCMGSHTCSRPCAFEEKKNREKKKYEKNPPHPKHATKSTAARRSRPNRDGLRRSTSHALRVSQYSTASIDPGFVEIGFVQLSQSVKTTNVTHTH